MSSGELSKRDKLLLIMCAITEVNERQGGKRNTINFSGSLLSSQNTAYLDEICESMADWSETQLIEFAELKLAEMRSLYLGEQWPTSKE